MEKAQAPGLTSTFASTFSLHSLADSSNGPAISEAEEIHEVKNLLKHGEKAFVRQRFPEALRCYNDALDIDEHNVESLAGRAAVYIETGNFILAQQDADRVLTLDPHFTQGYYLQGVALHNLGNVRESLTSFLKAIDLEAGDSPHMGILTNNLASIVTKFCTIPDKLMQKLPEMDAYKKLCEVGSCLYQAGRYDICIKVLTAAQRLQTNQKGITMKVQLTLANAFARTKQRDVAIACYQECLQTSIAAHDPMYRTKALVSMASLLLEIGNTHQAIVYYEKLLALKKELQNEDEGAPLPEYWNNSLSCALHLNLSIAYKTIGCMTDAITHAKIYVSLIKEDEGRIHAQAQSHYNVGMLHEILSDYQKALEHYKQYLELSKSKSDKKGIAQAYGCLGSVYAQLKNTTLSITFHEQHIQLARKLDDNQLLTIAHEQLGDTHLVLGNPDAAVDQYTEMYQSCLKNDLKNQTTALCKLGNAYKELKRFQYGLYYYEQAHDLAKELGFDTHRYMCENQMAGILQHSTQIAELEQARGYFQHLIPLIEGKIQQHKDENTFCPSQLQEQLKDCYDGMVNVLCKLGDDRMCLNYAEAAKRKRMQQLTYGSVATGFGGTMALYDVWTMDKIKRVVTQQNSTVVYYALLQDSIMIWVLQPGVVKHRFFTTRPPKEDKTWAELINETIAEIRNERDIKELKYECENRSLPLRDLELERLRQQNQKLTNVTNERKEYREDLEKDIEVKKETTGMEAVKTPQRRLFDYILSPVYDVFEDLEENSTLVFVPDKELCDCPFSVMQDSTGKMLFEKFKITVVPSLFALDKAAQNEMNLLKNKDDLEFERSQAKFGSLPQLLASAEFNRTAYMNTSSSPSKLQFVSNDLDPIAEVTEDVDLKRTSNPRLITSGAHRKSPDILRLPRTAGPSRENTYLSSSAGHRNAVSQNSRHTPTAAFGPNTSPVPSQSSPSSPRAKSIGSPTSLEAMTKVNTLNTLVGKTSTDTDITASEGEVVPYKQVSSRDRCVVIGAPDVNKDMQLYGRQWKPATNLSASHAECQKVSDLMDVEAITGEHATKQRFMEEMKTATVLHIATIGCLHEGKLVFTPNPIEDKSSPAPEHSFVVTAEEIAANKMAAKLVVISGCWSFMDRDYVDEGYLLPGAFIAAGAQCVLTLLWPLPNRALNKLYFHLYSSLQQGTMISEAVTSAMHSVQEDDRYSRIGYWSPYLLIGKDVYVDLKEVRHAMLDQMLDRVEARYADFNNNNPLNPPEVTPIAIVKDSEEDMPHKEENLHVLQQCLARVVCEQLESDTPMLSDIIDMCDGALKRLHIIDNLRRTTVLPPRLTTSAPAVALLKLLGFHFQSPGAIADNPYVLYPHSNAGDLLVPTYEAVKALSDLNLRPECVRCLHDVLPLPQESVSYIVDLLCITKHAPEIQLKVSDLSIKPLWRNPKVRSFFIGLGYHQVGMLLNFNSLPTRRKLLSSSLQFFLSMSIHKNNILLHKLDVSLLGPPPNHVQMASTLTFDTGRLPSLTPLLLPRNQLRMSTPWLTGAENSGEMEEKIRLATSKSDVDHRFRSHFSRAKTWHQYSVGAQADEVLDKVGRPVTSPQKVKVKSGSHSRRAMDQQPELGHAEVNQRRDYAHFVYKQRLGDVGLKHRDSVRKLYLPFIAT